MNNPNYHTLSATTMIGDNVKNPQGETLGSLKEVMIDVENGCIAYAVLSFGGFLGMGDKLFALPWESLKLNREDHSFTVDISRDRLEDAPGFDKDNWPKNPDRTFVESVHTHYGVEPYWNRIHEPMH